MRSVLMVILAVLLSACASTNQLSDPEPTKGEKAARINTQLGVAYMREGQYEQAADKLQKALRQAPHYAEAYAVSAVLAERIGEHEKAQRYHRRAVELAPDNASMLNNFGRFLCTRGKVDEALGYFERAVGNSLYRTPEVPLGNAGLCLMREGDRTRAEDYFLRALRANPTFAPALLPMAEIRLQNGDALSARGFHQRYVEQAPQTAASLWLGIRIERELGNRDAAASYSLLLRNNFPDSEEARKLRETAH